jgi:hypothetical protein
MIFNQYRNPSGCLKRVLSSNAVSIGRTTNCPHCAGLAWNRGPFPGCFRTLDIAGKRIRKVIPKHAGSVRLLNEALNERAYKAVDFVAVINNIPKPFGQRQGDMQFFGDIKHGL